MLLFFFFYEKFTFIYYHLGGIDKGEHGLSGKLNESILRGKEVLDSFVSIEKDVKNFEDNLNRRYDADLKRRQENKKKSPFEVILNCFSGKKQKEKK